MIRKAKDLLNNSETAVCVFTRGLFFDLKRGTTGYWHINPEAVVYVDKVIVYFRDGGRNRIFMGDYSGITPAPINWTNRYIIKSSEFVEVGLTDSNWLKFGDGSQTPAQIIRNL